MNGDNSKSIPFKQSIGQKHSFSYSNTPANLQQGNVRGIGKN